jgi:hypothetical protein
MNRSDKFFNFAMSALLLVEVGGFGFMIAKVLDERKEAKKLNAEIAARMPPGWSNTVHDCLKRNGISVSVQFDTARDGIRFVSIPDNLNLCLPGKRSYLEDGSTGFTYDPNAPRCSSPDIRNEVATTVQECIRGADQKFHVPAYTPRLGG